MWDFQEKYSKQKRLKSSKKRRGKREGFHLYRVPIEIRLEGRGLGSPKVTLTGRLLSTELTAQGMEFFTTHHLGEGQFVSINIKDGSKLYIRAMIEECKRYKLTQTLIQEIPHPYRVRVIFDLSTNEEKRTVSQFAESFAALYVAGGNKRLRR